MPDDQLTVNTWDPIANEAVDVPGHRMDREPDMEEAEARRAHLNDELASEDCPILLESDMRTDPCEGTQGSYTAVVERSCDECPSEFGIESMHTLAGVGAVDCLLCGHNMVIY